MKLSEVFAGFFKAAAESGITIEADQLNVAAQEPTTMPQSEPAAAPTAQQDDSALRAEMEAQRAALEAAQARVAKLEAEARDARLAALIQGWHGESAAHLAILAALGEGTPAFDAYAQQQRAVAELARQSAVFASAGTDRAAPSSAWARIEGQARKIAAEQGITVEQATLQVMDADPALYRQYMSEAK